MITLCAESDGRGAGDHHLLLGHCDDYESMNASVRSDATGRFHGMTRAQLRASAAWRTLVGRRPVHLDEMPPGDRRALRRAMDRHMAAAGIPVRKS